MLLNYGQSPRKCCSETSGSGPGLDSRDRALISVAALVALYRTEPLRHHIRRAIGLGVTKEELSELITQVAFYAGFPAGAHAATVTKEVFTES